MSCLDRWTTWCPPCRPPPPRITCSTGEATVHCIDSCVEKYFIREELDELLGQVDYVVSTLPATPATDNLLNRWSRGIALVRIKPLLLVQRCNGATAGLGYLEVLELWRPCKFLSLGSWLVSALSNPNRGEGYNSSTAINPDTITSIQLQCIQASRPSSRQNHKQTPTDILYVLICEINIQKEWHWPPNI